MYLDGTTFQLLDVEGRVPDRLFLDKIGPAHGRQMLNGAFYASCHTQHYHRRFLTNQAGNTLAGDTFLARPTTLPWKYTTHHPKHDETRYYNTASPIRPCMKAPSWPSPCSPTRYPIFGGVIVSFCRYSLKAVLPRCPVLPDWTLSWLFGRALTGRGVVPLGPFFCAPQ